MSKKYFYLNWDQIVDSELLSVERLAEVKAAAEARFSSLFDGDGNKVGNLEIYWVNENGKKKEWVVPHHTGAKESAFRTVVADVLTEAECELLNREWSLIRREKEDAAKFENAEKIAAKDWNAGVVWNDDRYFGSVDEFIDYWQDEYGYDLDYPEPYPADKDVGLREPLPKFVWGTKAKRIIRCKYVADIFENDIDCDGWEDMDTNNLNGVEELQKALDKFVEDNQEVISYWPDYSKAILL